ncbi:MAG: glycosyltransferase, partial [Pseudomonadota bacterium]|nr:glycosyltransferase [Pseudomonadota bacterium]
SKGVLDLIEAVSRLDARRLPRFHLRLVGNLNFSDPAYIARIRTLIARYGLGELVEFAGTADDATLAFYFRRAHVLTLASYHEGFCVPVAEALRAGAIPITYDAGNLPAIANGLGRLSPTGNVTALASGLAELIADVDVARHAPHDRHLRLDRGCMSAAAFTEAAHAYMKTLTYDRFVERTRERVLALAGQPACGIRAHR